MHGVDVFQFLLFSFMLNYSNRLKVIKVDVDLNVNEGFNVLIYN